MANKINCLVIDRHTIQLQEDARKGDIIDLDELEQIDKSKVEEIYEQGRNEYTAGKVQSAKLEAAAAYEQEKGAVSNAHNAEIQKLKDSYNQQIQELKDAQAKELQKLNNQITELNGKYEKDIALKDEKIGSIEKETSGKVTQEYEKKLSEQKTEYEIKINNLQNQVAGYDQAKNAELAQKDAAFTAEKSELENGYKDQIRGIEDNYKGQLQEKDEKIANLERARSSLSNKLIGEDLEQWAIREYNNQCMLGGFGEYTTFDKANTSIRDEGEQKGTKPDFLFRVYADKEHVESELTSVCLEMKSESPDSVNRQKNSKFYDKLNQDRIKNNCEYALLVSELELDNANDCPIAKVPGFEKMYVVRPQYMIPFLSLIYSLGQKYAELLTAEKKEALLLKNKEDLINEFEGFKKTYLENPLGKLENKVGDIKKEAENAKRSVDKIIGYSNDILDNEISNIKTKIDRFDIRKIGRKLDKLEKSDN